MRTLVVALFTLFFSGTSTGTLERRNPARLKQACECAKAHLIWLNTAPTPTPPAPETEKVNKAWATMLSITTSSLAQIRTWSDVALFSLMAQLAPVTDVVNTYHGLPLKKKRSLDITLGSPHAAFLQEYFGARGLLIERLVEQVFRIIDAEFKLPKPTEDDLDEHLQRVEEALSRREMPTADELRTCWAHIEAMVKSPNEHTRRHLSLTEIAEKMDKMASPRELQEYFEQQLETLKELEAELSKVERPQTSDLELIKPDGKMLEKITNVRTIAKRQREGLDVVYKIIQSLVRREQGEKANPSVKAAADTPRASDRTEASEQFLSLLRLLGALQFL